MSSPHKLSQYMHQELLANSGWAVYQVTVKKQLKLLYLITVYGKYCNSKKELCDDIAT